MFCEKCGTQLEEDALFCPECGTKVEREEIQAEPIEETQEKATEETQAEAPEEVQAEALEETQTEEATVIMQAVTPEETQAEAVVYCPNCGQKNEADALFCSSCGASLKDEEQPDGGEVVSGATPRKGKKKVFVGIAAAAAVVAFAAVIFIVGRGIFGGGSKQAMMVYVKDNEAVSFRKGQSAVIGDRVWKDKDDIYGPDTNLGRYNTVQLSEDGNYIFYPKNCEDSSYDLYCRKAKNAKAEEIKLASSIYGYTVLKNDKVLWRDDEYRLYISDFAGNKEKVTSDEVRWDWVSEDGKNIMWLTSWEDDAEIRICDAALEEDAVKLDSDVDSVIYASEDLSTIVYQKDGALYCMGKDREKHKVESDELIGGRNSGYVLTGSADETVIYYMTAGDDEILWGDLLDDDCGREDREDKDRSWEEEEKRYYRDEMRERMENRAFNTTVLHRYIPGEEDSEEIAEGALYFFGNDYRNNGKSLLYGCFNIDEMDKLKLSDLSEKEYAGDYGDESAKLYEKLTEVMELHMIRGDKEVVMDYDAEEYGLYPWDRGEAEDEKVCYISVNDCDFSSEYAGGYSILYSGEFDDTEGLLEALWESADYSGTRTILKINCGKMDGKLEVVTEGDSQEIQTELMTDKGIYYMEDVKNGEGELYFNGHRVDSDVKAGSVRELKNEAGVCYLTDMNKNLTEGTLSVYDGSEAEKIADDVAYYCSNEKGEIAFLADYNFNRCRGELKQYKNGKVKSIDTDVTEILFFQ